MRPEISNILETISPKWALLLSNGKVISSKLDGKVLGKMVLILRAIINDVEVGNIVLIKDLIIFRITYELFIFIIIEDVSKDVIVKKCNEIYSKS